MMSGVIKYWSEPQTHGAASLHLWLEVVSCLPLLGFCIMFFFVLLCQGSQHWLSGGFFSLVWWVEVPIFFLWS